MAWLHSMASSASSVGTHVSEGTDNTATSWVASGGVFPKGSIVDNNASITLHVSDAWKISATGSMACAWCLAMCRGLWGHIKPLPMFREATMCQPCYRPAGWAGISSKRVLADIADPYVGNGRSRWLGPFTQFGVGRQVAGWACGEVLALEP